MLTRNTRAPLHRSDLAIAIDAYRAASHHPLEWAWAISGVAGLAAGAALITVTISRGWPRVLEPIFFFGGWAVMLNSLRVVLRRSKRLRAEHQIACPACGGPLIDRYPGGRQRLAAEYAIATGRCSRCDAEIVE